MSDALELAQTITVISVNVVWFIFSIVAQLLARRRYNMFVADGDEEERDERKKTSIESKDTLPLLSSKRPDRLSRSSVAKNKASKDPIDDKDDDDEESTTAAAAKDEGDDVDDDDDEPTAKPIKKPSKKSINGSATSSSNEVPSVVVVDAKKKTKKKTKSKTSKNK